MAASMQPIIRGVQNVGQVEITYRYLGPDNKLPVPSLFTMNTTDNAANTVIDCGDSGLSVAGFRLDSEFLRATPQIASSFVIPILGGGGVALTNNNRTGTLTLRCAKVAAINPNGADATTQYKLKAGTESQAGVRNTSTAGDYYDLVTLAQIQMSQDAGDSYGANITIAFTFSGITTKLTFEMCTVATVDPVGLAGNDAANYDVVFNYLNWSVDYSSDTKGA